MKRIIYVILLYLHLASNVFSTNYYISSGSEGDDTLLVSNLSPDTPWKSLNKMDGINLNPGDNIFLKNGSIWRDQLKLNGSGSISSRITVQTYGIGNKPVIIGSKKLSLISDWSLHATNIWKANVSQCGGIWFIEGGDTITGLKQYENGIAGLDSVHNWTFDSNYIYIYDNVGNPAYRGIVEAAEKHYGIYASTESNNRQYITIRQLDMKFQKTAGIKLTINDYNWIIEYCRFSYTGTPESLGTGILIYGNYNIIRNNISFRHGHSGFALRAGVGATNNNVGNSIESNIIYNNYHNNIDALAQGTYKVENLTIKKNRIYATTGFPWVGNAGTGASGIHLQGNDAAEVKNTKINYNIISNTTGNGIHLANNNSTTQLNVNNTEVISNTIYDSGQNSGTRASLNLLNDACTVKVYNNIGMNASTWAIRLESKSNKFINYNLWFQDTGYGTYVAGVGPSGSIIIPTWTEWIDPNGNYKFDINSVTWGTDPNFSTSAFKLTYGSPAIDRGTYWGMSSDYDGTPIWPYSWTVDVGAQEYHSLEKEGSSLILSNSKNYYKLDSNYPNPFNPITKINYSIEEDAFVSLKVFDVLGKEIKTLVNEIKTKGNYSVNFDGSSLSSGVYVYTIKTNNFTASKKMNLMK